MHDIKKKHDVGGDIKQRAYETRQTRGVEEQGNRQKKKRTGETDLDDVRADDGE